jgi:uncharacterized protein with NRDE domain
MCTLIVATRVWQSVPLVVAANRDERLGRPAEPPTLRDEDGMQVLAPRDLEAGGTWMGINACGVFVAITNRFAPKRSDRRSRGQLVLDMLQEQSPERAVARVMDMSPTEHNPFHLLLADHRDAHLVWSDGDKHRHEPLAPGFHVVTERSFDAAPTKRIELLHDKLRDLFGPKPPSPEAWQKLLGTRSDEALEGINVHDEKRGYGTRSSSILYMAEDPERLRFLHAEGQPDRVPYVDLSSELRTLLQAG